jgi:hypothetical protein
MINKEKNTIVKDNTRVNTKSPKKSKIIEKPTYNYLMSKSKDAKERYERGYKESEKLPVKFDSRKDIKDQFSIHFTGGKMEAERNVNKYIDLENTSFKNKAIKEIASKLKKQIEN